MQEEHESYKLKWAGESDANDITGRWMRRGGIALCLGMLKPSKSEMKADEHHEEHESYKLRWAEECAANYYQRQMDEKRRDGFALGIAEAKQV